MSRQPKRDLRRKQNRRKKLKKLHERLENATTPRERERLIAKIRKISTTSPVPDK